MNQGSDEPQPGDRVAVPWGMNANVIATVAEVYGPPTRRHVLVIVDPETSGEVVAEEMTYSVPIHYVKAPEAA